MGQPCYALQGKNVILIGGFKEYCALLFFKGALLADSDRLLVAPGKTQAGRQMRSKSLQEIAAKERIIATYIGEAIRVEQTGLKASLKAHSEYRIPEELANLLDRSDRLKQEQTRSSL